ncbi:MAG: glycosyltransferase [Gomphosphaeria aponina SAG 52.96 = DSM 107014]|uniref:Glycosyltransferase n=1 Tax=Gomphosphaeria aponina SAG 52.96 = DSM 107014 TaxID=1521640 RepID=A0A941JSK2_9CHRO|nr:glycosyltransferase [Gomphosphaeria aponina SAG 52.96 = DSM 107014]
MIDKEQNRGNWLHIVGLLGWLTLGIGLRFTNLGDKSPSSIEISTLGFSLGNGFLAVPLDQVISLDTLLLPVAVSGETSPATVITRLMSESNHPPLYFVLTHFWLKVVSVGDILWEGRSLSAILGAAAIPALFGFGWLTFRSRDVAQMAAALMAVSPYGIYLAQEARHYTLTILWIIASLSCLVVATRFLESKKNLPVWVGCVWAIANSLGVATHYFFFLVIYAEGLVIGWFWWRDFHWTGYWRRIYAVAAGTAIGCLVWLPVILGVSEQELTDWIETSYALDEIWTPIPRLLAWWITMVFLLPVEGRPLVVTILSGLILLLVLVWVAPGVIGGLKGQMKSTNSMSVLVGFLGGAIALFLIIIYVMGKDLSLAARYHFVYFPVIIVLLAAALAICWQEIKGMKNLLHFSLKARGKQVVVGVLLMGLLGGITVVTNYGYQKNQRADLLISQIQANSKVPVLIATTYKTHAELRSLIGVGFEFQRQQLQPPSFILLDKNNYAGLETPDVLQKTLNKIQRPLDLWGVNLNADSDDLEALNCWGDSLKSNHNGYRVRLYHCG